MSLLSEQTIQEVRDKTDLVALVQEHLTLKRSGSSWKGLCPFHDENHPSFNVTPAMNIWHCFGCGLGGDAIDFVQELQGAGFREAVRILAEKANITVQTTDGDGADERDENGRAHRARLQEVNRVASEFFSKCLLEAPEAEVSRAELARRGIDIHFAVQQFGCGHSPNDWNTTPNYLRRQGFTDQEIVDAGLASMSDRGRLAFRFRGRMMWTITNTFGNPIGFGARKMLDTDDGPKFLNSPETALYKKSAVLFGYSRARTNIVKAKRALVVEGYTDVVACHLAGVEIAVAACGTAFTPEHKNTLRGVVGEAGEITFGLDDDAAGHKATLKVYDVAKDAVARLTALTATEGMDPDEYRQARGDEALRALIDQREPLLWRVIKGTVATLPRETDEDRLVALNAALPLVSHAPDPILRHRYAVRLADLLGFSPDEVLPRVQAHDPAEGPDWGHKNQPASGARAGAPSLEREVVGAFVNSETTTREFAHEVDSLAPQGSPIHQVLTACVKALHSADSPHATWQARVARQAEGDVLNWVQFLAMSGAPTSAEDRTVEHAREMIRRMRQRSSDRERAEARRQMAEARTDEERLAAQERFMRAVQMTNEEGGGV